MECTQVFEVQAWNAPTILPRICLVLSRRRLIPERLNFAVASDPRFCTLKFSVCCDQRTAARLHAQLARVAELTDISMHTLTPLLRPASEVDTTAAA